MIVFAIIGGFVVGAIVGFVIVNALALSDAWHKSKRECRECLRNRVESGFYVDGKRYRCIEDKGETK